MKAWATIACGVESFVGAETRGRAIATTLRSAREAGWSIAWPAVRAVRAPQYDAVASRMSGCMSAEYVAVLVREIEQP